MALKSALIWTTDRGRELIRLREGAADAAVLVCDCDPATLRELAKAATEAAEQIEAFAADAAEVNGR